MYTERTVGWGDVMRKLFFSIIFFLTALTTILIFQNCSKGAQSTAKNNRAPSSEPVASSLSPSTQLSSKSSYYTSLAQDTYRRLAGVTLDLDDPKIIQMTDFIQNGQARRAAELATQSREFFNITVRDMAAKMSTKEITTLAPLSDFVATFIGVVRDNTSAKELLTGNFYYRANNVSGVGQDLMADIIKSNKHYDQLDEVGADLSAVLVREDGQKILGASGAIEINPDAAGLLTSRAFLQAHAKAGTNRRIIEYSFKIFLCSPIASWASLNRPDFYVGRDVGRTPASEFNNKCKGCHSGMDAMRPATAYYDFFVENEAQKTGFIKYKYTYANDPRDDDATKVDVPVPSAEQNVPYKFRRSSRIYPEGFKVRNDSWTNYVGSAGFGWKTELKGQGLHDFGKMLSESEKYAECLVQNVFLAVCKKELQKKDYATSQRLVNSLKSSNYNLRELFISTALEPDCFGLD